MATARRKTVAAAEGEAEILRVGARDVAISNPGKVLFPKPGHTKLDLARYYVAVADGALRGAGGRPNMLVRYPDGVDGEHFYQKRAPGSRPDWIEVVELSFPSGRAAEEVVPRDAAALAWIANLGCLELHPHPVRAEDLDHPDELRVDLDPVPGVEWPQIQQVAQVARAVLEDLGLVGWPKTSGSRGIHLATSKWWKEERHGVFVDYNQNAKDRTVASAYSVRPKPDARVSAPITWDELDACDPADFTLASMPARFAQLGDLHAGIDRQPGSIEKLLELFERQGQGDAPWPPHYRKQASEPPRVQPSRRKSAGRRNSSMPLIEIGRARRKADAEAGLERWKARHAEAAAHLRPADVLVDSMRGRYSTWTRIRVNLQHVPPALRPAQEPLDPDEKIRSSS